MMKVYTTAIAAASVGLKVLHLKEGMTVEKDIVSYL